MSYISDTTPSLRSGCSGKPFAARHAGADQPGDAPSGVAGRVREQSGRARQPPMAWRAAE